MIRIKGRCTKRHEPLVARLSAEIQARRLAKFDAGINDAVARFFSGDATLADLETFKRALCVAEFEVAKGAS